jgi:hypothetical protein
VALRSSDPLARADGRCSVHPIALGSAGAGGAGAALVALTALIYPAMRLVTMFTRNRQGGGYIRRWPAAGPGGAGYGQPGTRPHVTGQGDQPAHEHAHPEQDHAYWEPEEEDGTLPADGFIGDPARTNPSAGQA